MQQVTRRVGEHRCQQAQHHRRQWRCMQHCAADLHDRAQTWPRIWCLNLVHHADVPAIPLSRLAGDPASMRGGSASTPNLDGSRHGHAPPLMQRRVLPRVSPAASWPLWVRRRICQGHPSTPVSTSPLSPLSTLWPRSTNPEYPSVPWRLYDLTHARPPKHDHPQKSIKGGPLTSTSPHPQLLLQETHLAGPAK